MLTGNRYLFLGTSLFALMLCACGGGGGGEFVQSTPPRVTPPPPPPPPPTPTTPEGANTALDIIDNAPTGNFAVAGVGAPDWGAAIPSVSLAPADQPKMRYDAASNTYEIQFSGKGWETLWTMDTSLPAWARPVGVGLEPSTSIAFGIDRKPNGTDPYPYSVLAMYSYPVNGVGAIAFGIPTPADAVPSTGSAKYDGIISGVSDIYVPGSGGDPWPELLGVDGSVTLSFDFSKGTLGGSMQPVLSSGESLGTFTFKNTVYSAGAYSGQFDTTVSGTNGFYGQLTGPHAEELIGAWALRFHYQGDSQDHQAIGAWVAKH